MFRVFRGSFQSNWCLPNLLKPWSSYIIHLYLSAMISQALTMNEKVYEKCGEINESIRKQSRSWGDIVLTSSILQSCLQLSPRGAAVALLSQSPIRLTGIFIVSFTNTVQLAALVSQNIKWQAAQLLKVNYALQIDPCNSHLMFIVLPISNCLQICKERFFMDKNWNLWKLTMQWYFSHHNDVMFSTILPYSNRCSAYVHVLTDSPVFYGVKEALH